MSDERIVDVSTILSKWHDLLKDRLPNFPCQTFPMFIRNNSQELVRCRECKHFVKYHDDYRDEYRCDGYCKEIDYIMDGYYRGAESRNADDFCSHGEKMGGGTEGFEVFNRYGEKFTVYGVIRNDDENETTDFLIFDGYRFVWKESEFFIPADGGAE